MTSARRALAYTFSSQYLVLVVQFVATIVIARLLTPAEVGIFSVGAALVSLGHLLRDFGSGQYIIQEQNLTTDRIRAAFTVTLILGWGMGGLLFAVAPMAATFYAQPGIENILSLLALNFCLLPFGSITLAYLRRQMNFKPSAVASVSSTLISATASMVLAFQGFSYMSLAWGSLAGTIATILLVSLFRPKDLPILPGFKEIRRVLSFGGKLSAVTVLSEIAALIPELVLGKTQGFHEVGLFSRTQSTVGIFTRLVMVGIGPVIGPLFASKKQKHEELRQPYLHGVTCVTGLAWMFYANLAVLASPFVLTLYGIQWEAIIPFVQLWCLSSIVYHLTSLAEQVLVGTGNVSSLLRMSVIFHPFRIVAFAAAATISLEAVFVVILTTPWLRLGLLWSGIKRVTGASLADHVNVARISGVPAIASALMAATVLYILGVADIVSPGFILIVCSIASGCAWIFVIYASHHPLINEAKNIMQKRLRNKDKQ